MTTFPSKIQIFRVFLSIGMQSFGGGATTWALIERASVHEQRWLTEEQYLHDLAMAQLSPGINLLALTILIGRRMGGATSAGLAILGLLLPSVAITIVMTALYAHIRNNHHVALAMRSVIPATVGIGLLTAYNLMRSLLVQYRAMLLNMLIIVGSIMALAVWHLPVILVLISAGVVGAIERSFKCPL